MENLIFEKIWQDNDIIEIKILAESKYAKAYQTCYIQEPNLLEIAHDIREYIKSPNQECYIQIGEKEGNFTPAFSMKIVKVDYSGHMKIEVDIEIDDSEERLHRCIFYISSDLGSLEYFGKSLQSLYNAQLGDRISLQ